MTSPLSQPSGTLQGTSSANIVEIPNAHGFKSTARRASVVIGSVGRGGLVMSDKFLSASPSGPGNPADEETFLLSPDTPRYQLVAAEEAEELLTEQEELLLDSGIPADQLSSAHKDRLERKKSIVELANEVSATGNVWESAIAQGKIHSSRFRELQTITKSSVPLIITFFLQYSVSVASVFAVGHLGRTELAAVSLATMTANITGFSLFQGMSTALDTLCSQAYGAGKPHMVGMYFQRGSALILTAFVPISFIWWHSASILSLVIPDEQLVGMAAQYLRVMILAGPGYILFEAGKRFVQAQGIFHAGTYILVVCAPLNIVLSLWFVWSPTLGLGFLGAPLAVALNYNLMALLLGLYVRFVDGRKCWNGLQIRESFSHWVPLLRLAIPGVVAVMAEFLAFEILTLASSRLGTTVLAAQSVISTVASLAYQVPFALAIAGSTRIANFVGATLKDSAKLAMHVTLAVSMLVALMNAVVLVVLRRRIPAAFSSDVQVVETVARVLPFIACIQMGDALSAVSGGCLRGIGAQRFGGIVNMLAYYLLGIPMSFFTAFYLGWGLIGLWFGMALALLVIGVTQSIYLFSVNWDRVVREAEERNTEERITT